MQILGKKPSSAFNHFYKNDLQTPPPPILRNVDNFSTAAIYRSHPPPPPTHPVLQLGTLIPTEHNLVTLLSLYAPKFGSPLVFLKKNLNIYLHFLFDTWSCNEYLT